MTVPKAEIIAVIYALLPGFLAAWCFYVLSHHRKPSPFERVVQALIFTGFVRFLITLLQGVALFLGRKWSVGVWSEDVSLGWSFALAMVVGVFAAALANNDQFHAWFRRVGVTTKISSSEWFASFQTERRYVVLHLVGERRLFGWPFMWPDYPDSGHFVIMEPEWLLDDGNRVPVYASERILIAASDVSMVEFVEDAPLASVSYTHLTLPTKRIV